MRTAKGVEVDARWIDKNACKIPPMLSDEIKKTVREYWKKYHDSDYLLMEQKRELDRWVTTCNLDDDIEDELI